MFPLLAINLSKALSVVLPPITCILPSSLSFIMALVLFSKDVLSNFSKSLGISSTLSYSFRSPLQNPTTSNCPFVIVPVLSENNIFKLPAVSIPTSFLTSILSFNNFLMFNDSTIAIIIGNPSGTATTIMIIASIIAVIKSFTGFCQFDM